MFVEGKSRTVFFPSDTLICGISRDGSTNYNIRTCEHIILGQLRMGARQTNYVPLLWTRRPACLAPAIVIVMVFCFPLVGVIVFCCCLFSPTIVIVHQAPCLLGTR